MSVSPEGSKAEFVTDSRESPLPEAKTRNGITLVPQPSNDPRDPLNWSKRKKLTTLAILSLAGFAGTSSALANQLGLKAQAKLYHKELAYMTYTLSASIAGIAYGPLLIIPLAHIIGRMSVIWWSLVFSVGCGIWSARMTSPNDYEAFVVSRLFSGMFGSIPSILGAGAIVDIFFLHERGRAYATFHLSFLFGTVAGPTFGGFIVQNSPWPIQFWWVVALQGMVIFLAFIFLEDTGYSRDQSIQYPHKPTGFFANRIATFFPGSRIVPSISGSQFRTRALAPFKIGLSPIGLLVGIFAFASFGWFVATHNLLTVFLEQPVKKGGYGFTPQRNAFFIFALWVALGAAQLWGFLVNDRLALWFCQRRGGVWKPEYRLHSLWIPSLIILPIGLGILGSALQYHLHYMVLALGAFLITFAAMGSVPVTVNYVIECFKAYPTECSAAVGAYRLSLGLAVPFFIDPWIAAVHGSGWVYGMMAFFSIFAFSMVVVLMFTGEKLRHKFLIRLGSEEIGTKILALERKGSD